MVRLLALPVTVLVLALVAIGCSDPSSITHFAASSPPADTSADTSTGTSVRATVAHLDPELRRAVRSAVADARDDDVRIEITSGWRSREHQQRLYDEAVVRYGSEEEASRYVATPDRSEHVTGDAVDLGPGDEARSWLREHGAAYGLCQMYANETWHFELATAPGGTCPPVLPDGSYAS